MKNLLHRIETYLNRHLAYWLTNGNKQHRLERYAPERQKDYKTRNERIKWLHRVIGAAHVGEDIQNGCHTFEQLKAAERLAELFARHHGEKFSPSAGKELDKRYKYLNLDI